jgi:hypothetical protein
MPKEKEDMRLIVDMRNYETILQWKEAYNYMPILLIL